MTGRSSRLEDIRADSIRRANVCTERRANSNHKELTRSINRADSKTSEPTRTTHTDKITASFFSLLQIQIFKRLDFKSQRSVSWKTIIKAVKAPLEYIQERRGKRKEERVRRKGLLPYFHQIPKESQGEFEEHIISSSKIRRPLGDSEEDHQKLKEQEYKVFFKAHQAATTLTTRFCLLLLHYFYFPCIRFLVSLKTK